jgi:hypothetical protein
MWYQIFQSDELTDVPFLACYTADLNGVKGLSAYKYQSTAMTSQTCRAACKGQGFALSGTYNGDREWNYYTGARGKGSHNNRFYRMLLWQHLGWWRYLTRDPMLIQVCR